MNYRVPEQRPMTMTDFHLHQTMQRLTALEQKVNGTITAARQMAWRIGMMGGMGFIMTGDLTLLKPLAEILKALTR